MYKPKKCPKCKSSKVLGILYGLPTDEVINDSEVYLGGCCVFGNDPKWHCDDCHWQWGGGSEGDYCEDDIEEEKENIRTDYIDLWGGGHEAMQEEIKLMDKEIDKLDYLFKIYDLNRKKVDSIIILDLFNKAKKIVDGNFNEYIKSHSQEKQIKQAGLHYFFAIYLMIVFGKPKNIKDNDSVKTSLKKIVSENNNIEDLYQSLLNFDFYLGSCGIEAQNLAINT